MNLQGVWGLRVDPKTKTARNLIDYAQAKANRIVAPPTGCGHLSEVNNQLD